MSRAKQRKYKGIKPKTKELFKQIEQIPQHWSIVFTIEVEGILYVTLCQDEPNVLRLKFCQVIGKPAMILEQTEENSSLVITHPIRLEQLALLCPDKVHAYLKEVMYTGQLRQLEYGLCIADYGNATVLKQVLEVWRKLN